MPYVIYARATGQYFEDERGDNEGTKSLQRAFIYRSHQHARDNNCSYECCRGEIRKVQVFVKEVK